MAAAVTAPSSSPRFEQPSRVVFLFPGQGSQHRGVAQDLYDLSPAYAAAFDDCLDLFEAAGVPLRRWWQDGVEAQLQSPRAALPLTFAVEYALAQTWQSWGITPSAVLGVSIGEMAAASVAGVFTLDDAVLAVAARSQALQDLPPGGLLAVSASPADVASLLPDGVWIALILGPRHLVVGGSNDLLASAAEKLRGAGLASYPVAATHSAHGPYAAPAVPVFDRALRGLRLARPAIDFYSANTGQLVARDEAVDPGFWSRQLMQPVVFADALDTLAGEAGRLLMIEVGPGQTLTKAARQHPMVIAGRHRVLPTLAHHPVTPLAQARSALAAVGAVWAAGHAIDWPAMGDLVDIDRALVPGYPGPQPVERPQPPVAHTRTPDAVEARTDPTADPDRRPEPADPARTIDRLRRLWSTVLAEDAIAPDADFFDLGGDSLTAVELMSKVRAEFSVELRVVVLFEYSTLDALAAHIDRKVS
ncbi:MAG: acyltransferase domain-containing protein [Jatrophihabitans sp.]